MLANVAEARLLVLLEPTARPTWVASPIATVTLCPTWIQVTPSVA